MTERIVYYNDLTDLHAALESAGSRDAERAAHELVRQQAQKVAAKAQEYAPVKTGALRSSIVVEEDRDGFTVVATDPKAIFLEFGTWSRSVIDPKPGTYKIRPVRADALRFHTSDGRTVFTKKVEHPGVPAYQFLARANSEVNEDLSGLLGDIGVTLVMQ